ncbi:MAG: cytochrome c [Pseudomonadota bacterium]
MTVDNFELLDQHGVAHELYYLSNARTPDALTNPVVLVGHRIGCEVDVAGLADQVAGQVLLINSEPNQSRVALQAAARSLPASLPVLHDETQLVGEGLGRLQGGEAVVVHPDRWQQLYRGPLTGVAAAIARVDQAAQTDAGQAQPIAAQPVATPEPVASCRVDYEDRARPVTYSADIAPILERRCVTCHTAGGIGPWAMSEYNMIRGFAPMIREVLRTRRMPPWHADPHVGEWRNDSGISNAEKRTLVHWIEAGAPRGPGPDPLAERVAAAGDWPLGEPDLVIDIPEFAVPASGVVDYQFPAVPNPLDRDVWVRAVSVRPGDRTVVHHVLAGTTEPGEPVSDTESVFDNYLIGYAPGAESMIMPKDHGVFVPKGSTFVFQLHYTPTGRATVDRTKMALYFAAEPPKKFLRHSVVMDPTISIPPRDGAFEESAYFEFYRDATLYALAPHAHYRGRASEFALRYPDGREELLLSVPNYDFNWQRSYQFEQPYRAPAGSRLIHRTVYDNSALNPRNPDPERKVPWGLQSWDEMLYGDFLFSWDEETSTTPFHDVERVDDTQFVGFMDKNLNGLLERDELPRRMRRSLRMRALFFFGDSNDDDALSVEEFIRAKQRFTFGAAPSQDTPAVTVAGGG